MEDQALLDGIARKDPNDFEALVDRYSRYIAAVIAKVAGDQLRSCDVEEITSDILVKLWTDGQKIKLRGDSLKPYLAITARNHTLNALRKKQRVMEIETEVNIGQKMMNHLKVKIN